VKATDVNEKEVTAVAPFKKTVKFEKKTGYATVDVSYDDNHRLSISGTIRMFGPAGNGSGGQIYDELLAEFPKNKKAVRLVEIWKKWHLNDMNAGCEHQDDWDTQAPITTYEYAMDSDRVKHISDIKEEAIEAARLGRRANLTDYERQLLAAPHFITNDNPEPPFGYKLYKEKHDKAGWVRPEDHPQGLLTKPCPKCGHKYGTSWLFREVPVEILNELKEM
jgi:hypothetical protein